MRFDISCKLQKLMAKPGRYALGGAHLDATDDDAPVLVATNARAMAAVPVTEHRNAPAGVTLSGDIPKDAIIAAQKAKTGLVSIGDDSVSVETGGSTQTWNGRGDAPKFPDWRRVMPATGATEAVETISLNPFLLADLAEAMGLKRAGKGSKVLTLTFNGSSGPIAVTLGSDAVGDHKVPQGAIMPCVL